MLLNKQVFALLLLSLSLFLLATNVLSSTGSDEDAPSTRYEGGLVVGHTDIKLNDDSLAILGFKAGNRHWNRESVLAITASEGQYIRTCTDVTVIRDMEPSQLRGHDGPYIITGPSPSLYYQQMRRCPPDEQYPYRAGPLQSPDPFFVFITTRDKDDRVIPAPPSLATENDDYLYTNGYSLDDNDDLYPGKPGWMPMDFGWKDDLIVNIAPEADLQLFRDRLNLLASSFSKLQPVSYFMDWLNRQGNNENEQAGLAAGNSAHQWLRVSVRVNGGPVARTRLLRSEWESIQKDFLKKGFPALIRAIQPQFNGREHSIHKLLSVLDTYSDAVEFSDLEQQQDLFHHLQMLLELPDTEFSLEFETRQLAEVLASGLDSVAIPANAVIQHDGGGDKTQSSGSATGKGDSAGTNNQNQASPGGTPAASGKSGAQKADGSDNGEGRPPKRPNQQMSSLRQASSTSSQQGRLTRKNVEFQAHPEEFNQNLLCGEGVNIGCKFIAEEAFQVVEKHEQGDEDLLGTRFCKQCTDKMHQDLKSVMRSDNAAQRDIKKLKFKCLSCPEGDTASSYIAYHKIDQHVDGHYVHCDTCSQNFRLKQYSSTAEKKRWLQDHSKSCKLQCQFCRTPQEKTSFNLHEITCERRTISCSGCGKELSGIENFLDHIVMKHFDTSIQCFLCQDKYHPNAMERHLESHKQAFTTTLCKYCDPPTIFPSSDIQNHLRVNHVRIYRNLLKAVATPSVWKTLSPNELEIADLLIPSPPEEIIQRLTQNNSDLKAELNSAMQQLKHYQKDTNDKNKELENTVTCLEESLSDTALIVQTLQATSYNGVFIWKIPEVHRRRHEAKIGKTISLYSVPFYTSRHGYKVCLRLYMDGDGSGRATHLSFFLTIMRGEYDALLQWPFRQTVTLTLLDQDKSKDIVQSFRPEPASSSFQRPRNEMNVASGCPLFAPLSILNNADYVKDDTMFLKCHIDRLGIDTE